MEAAVWGFIGTIVGALASTMATWMSVRSSSKLQEERVRLEKQERSNSLQRDTILELQETLHDMMRFVHRAYFEDRQALLAGTPWQESRLSEELDESLRLKIRRVAILIERLENADLRKQVKDLAMSAHQTLFAPDAATAQARLDLCVEAALKANEALGTSLRLHY
jgi:hypothetical protein